MELNSILITIILSTEVVITELNQEKDNKNQSEFLVKLLKSVQNSF